jgi:hypothetical protein
MASLPHALEHHAKGLKPLVSELALGFTTVLRPLGWDVKTVLGGANSWMFFKDSKEFHFRSYDRKQILVKRSYQGQPVETLKSSVDVLRFVRKLAGM